MNLRELIWCFLFRLKIIRLFVFYNIKRYKKKLKSLDGLNLKKESVIIDIGANNGVVAHYLFDKYSCNIHIFEPNPYCYELLKKIFKNNLKVKIYDKAVSNMSGHQKLYLSIRSADIKNMGLSEISSLEKKKINISLDKFVLVKSISIDELIKEFSYIDFIKIDIEGHEYKIMSSLIKNFDKINKIFCEMHGSTHGEEFKKDFEHWDKKLIPFKNRKFKYW